MFENYNKRPLFAIKILFLLVLFFTTISGKAQVGAYSFTQTVASYNSLTGTPTVAYTAPWDDHVAGAAVQATIPFTFTYDSNPYTQIYISPNGFITFGATQPTATNYLPLSDNTAYDGLLGGAVSALGIDLVSTGSDIVYGVIGTAPNRTFVIEWNDASRKIDTGLFNFQIRLSETSNVIAFAYGFCQPLGATNRTVQVGLRGQNNVIAQGNVFNRLQGSSQVWLGNTISGVVNNSTVNTSLNAYPNSGLLYTYTPALPCVTPPSQPTNLILGATSITHNAINGNTFTAAVPAPTKYLILRSTVNTPPTVAAVTNRVYYTVGTNIGTAVIYRVVNNINTLTFNQTGLLADTTYYYWIVPFNDSCAGGPFYNLTNILTANATTCSVPTTALAASAIGGNDFVANWTAVAGVTNYVIDVSTNNTFTALLPAYTNLSVGNVTSLPITGLLPLTSYFYRVRAIGSGCVVNSATINAITTCGYYNIPYLQNFDALPIGVLPSCVVRADVNADAIQWTTKNVNFSSASRSIQMDSNATQDMNDWFFLPGLNLTAGLSYRLFFKYNTGNISNTSENLKVQYGTSQTVAGMSVNLLNLPGIDNSFFNIGQIDFIPSTSGVFYIGFQGNSIANQSYIVIDDIRVTLSPTCLDPSNIVISSVTSNSALLSWTAPSPDPSSGYEYYMSTSNTPPIISTTPTGSVGAGITSVNLTGLLPSTYYYVWVRGNCGASDKSVWTLEESFNTECATPVIASTLPATRCGFGTVTMSATPNITSTVYWYDAPSNGNLLGIGNSYTTPVISSTTTYYAESKAFGAIEKVGPSSPLTQTGILGIQNYQSYVNFTVTVATYLQSVDIFPLVSGQLGRIAIRNSSNTTVALFPYTTSVSGGSTAQQILINYQLTPGNYNLYFETMPASGLRMNTNSAFYPYISSVANITGNGTDDNFNLGFYNWKFTTECISARVPVVATVTTPPSLTLSASSSTICESTATPLITVSGYASYDGLVWSPNTNVTGSFATGFVFNPSSTTVYTLIATQSSGSLCGNRITHTVNVLPSPAPISIIPATASICQNTIQPLSGSTSSSSPTVILSENFNASTNNWTVQNTSVGGNTLASQWTLQPNNYHYISPFWNVIFTSNDASQFYLANSDAQSAVPGIITRTTLTSPSMNLAGFTSANLSFWNYIRYTDYDYFYVQVSTDNGTNWTTIQTYNTTQGTASNFVNENVDMNAYIGNANVKIRFNYISPWAYVWAIDNVTVSGTLATALTWTPITGLYTDPAALVPYVAGTALSAVYAKPLATTTYTATVTGANSCFRTSTSTVTVTPTSIPGTVSSDQLVCSGTVPSDITLAGNIGSVLRWEFADNPAFTVNVTTIPNTTTTLTNAQMGTFSSIRYFRAVVKNGICNEVFSNIVYVSYPSTTWSGSWSNGLPDSSKIAIFNANYSSTGNISACGVRVTAGNVVFNADHSLIVNNDVIVSGGSLTFENNASLVQINNVTNSGAITYKRDTNPMKKFDYTYWSSPVAPQTFVALSPSTPSDKYYRFDPVINYWASVPSNSLMNVAKGYIIRAPFTFDPVTPSIFNGVFSGVPNNGTYTTPIVVSTGDFNLIGNPYPSAISADLFLSDVANTGVVDATIYLWTHNTPITANQYTSNDYAAYNYLGGTGTSSATNAGVNNTVPNGKIASGQSFFIRGLTNNNVTFRNSMRIIGDNNQFFRMEQPQNTSTVQEFEKHRIWLDIVNPQGDYKQILTGYAQQATNLIDRGFDGEFFDAGNSVALYSLVDTTKLTIQGKALPFSIDDEIPLGFKSTSSGNFTINLYNFDGLFLNQNIYLKDNYFNTIHNLKMAPYSFVSNSGTIDDRFVLVYKDASLNVDENGANDNAIIVYKPNDKVMVASGTEIMKEITVFDTRGRLILKKSNIDASQTELDLGTTNQVFIIQITTNDLKTYTKKYVN